MLQAMGASVPEDLVHLLTDVMGSLPPKEQRRIHANATQWARMLQPRSGVAGPASRPSL
jgi:hypothetical protein